MDGSRTEADVDNNAFASIKQHNSSTENNSLMICAITYSKNRTGGEEVCVKGGGGLSKGSRSNYFNGLPLLSI